MTNEKLAFLRASVQCAAAQVDAVAYGVKTAAAEVLSTAKLRVQIAGLENTVKLTLQEVGELLYATHTGTPTDSQTLQAKLEEIDALKAEIQILNDQIESKRPHNACPFCGAVIHSGDIFCRECGGKL